MRALLILPALALTGTAAFAQPNTENRCGWYANPTPGNHWLTDRDREWLIGAQGGYQSRGMDRIGDMSSNRRQWVATHPNGSYGYGCVCAQVRTDRRNSQITRIFSWRQVPLAQCRSDRRLREPRD